MESPVCDVPEALILVPLLAVSPGAVPWRLHSGKRFSWPRAVVGAAACGYGAGVLKEARQPFQVGIDEGYYPGWRAFVHLTPLSGAEPGDVLLFLLGVFLALLARARSARRVALIRFGLSLVIETTQLVLDVTVSTGRVADVSDLLGNTVGAAAGYALFRLSGYVAPLARLSPAMTWPSPHRLLADPSGRSSSHPSPAAAPDQGDRGNAHRAQLDHHPRHR